MAAGRSIEPPTGVPEIGTGIAVAFSVIWEDIDESNWDDIDCGIVAEGAKGFLSIALSLRRSMSEHNHI